jgi:ComF family protein
MRTFPKQTSPRRPSLWSRGTNSIAEKIFGGTCYLCRGASDEALCAPCRAELPYLARPRCPSCALPGTEETLCGRCLGDPPAFDATIAAFAYAFPADVLVQGLKFRSELALARLLANELYAAVCVAPAFTVDLIVPVPLHDARLRERGYNQSVEIARSVASRLDVPLAAEACTRVRDTAAQLDLPWKERRENVRGAFSCRQALHGKTVAVVDDVMTTGATLAEMAATLKKFGAARVVNWVVARTPAD